MNPPPDPSPATDPRGPVPSRAAGGTRRERQRAEILAAVREGRAGHALDLAFEHLDEFGDDPSVVETLAAAMADGHDRSLSAAFDAFLDRTGSADPQPTLIYEPRPASPEGPAMTTATPPDIRPAARRRVRRLAVAHAVSVAGSQAAQIGVVYAIYLRTHSGAWVTAALAASISVTGVVGPPAGWVADHFDRRMVMTVSELGAGAVYLVMVFAHAPLLLVLGALVASVAGSPFRAASAAAIPNLVPAQDLAWANGQLGAAFNLALVGGPIAGGALIAVSGAWAVFVLNAATFLMSAALIVTTPGRFGGSGDAHAGVGEPHALMAGFRVLVRSRMLGFLGAASALAFGAFGCALVIDPALSVHFHAGSVGYGLLTSTWGAGAVVGSLAAGRLATADRSPAAIVGGMVLMAVSLGSIPALPNFALIVAAGAVGGVGSGITFVPWLVVVQRHVADAFRGRVVAASETLNQLMFLVGMGVGSPAVSVLGPHRAYGVTGVILVLGALAGAAGLRAAGATPADVLAAGVLEVEDPKSL